VTFRCGDGVGTVAAQDVGSQTGESDKGFFTAVRKVDVVGDPIVALQKSVNCA
jgi:hypothetical protein